MNAPIIEPPDTVLTCEMGIPSGPNSLLSSLTTPACMSAARYPPPDSANPTLTLVVVKAISVVRGADAVAATDVASLQV